MKPEHQKFLQRIGDTVDELRKDKKIKIEKLVQETKMHRNSYRQLKNGETYFKISALLKILDYYQVDYYDFLKKIDKEDTLVGAQNRK